jgi:hypothetical protein
MRDGSIPLDPEGNIAMQMGCCLASCKEDCKRPPCPCNLNCWSPYEREQIRLNAQKKAER